MLSENFLVVESVALVPSLRPLHWSVSEIGVFESLYLVRIASCVRSSSMLSFITIVNL